MTKCFKNFNPNPTQREGKKWHKGDCVVRALAVAANITWLEAFDLLAEQARKDFNVQNDKKVYDKVLARLHFTKVPVKVAKGERRITVEEFCKKHPKGRYFVSISGHCTAVIDGVCYDTWFPGEYTVRSYYEL